MRERTVSPPPAAGIFKALLFACGAVGLAGQSSSEDVNESPQRSGVQVSEVAAENRRLLQTLFFHPGQEETCGVGFPFCETHHTRADAKDVLPGEFDGDVEHAGATAEAEQSRAERLEGMSHIFQRFRGQD